MSSQFVFSDGVVDKAMGFRDGKHVYTSTVVSNLYYVDSGENTYEVRIGEHNEERRITWSSCTCSFGKNRSVDRYVNCSHVAAVLLCMRERDDLPTRAAPQVIPVQYEGDPFAGLDGIHIHNDD